MGNSQALRRDRKRRRPRDVLRPRSPAFVGNIGALHARLTRADDCLIRRGLAIERRNREIHVKPRRDARQCGARLALPGDVILLLLRAVDW